jgi:hypothetical protein
MNMQLVLLAIYCYTIYCYIKILTITAFKTTVHEIYDVKCYILLLNCITISTSATLGLIYKCLIVLLQSHCEFQGDKSTAWKSGHQKW